MYAFMHSNTDELERKALKVWMRGVIASQHMSAYEWAIKAKISQSTITRFLSGASEYIPSSRTVAKLVAIAGSEPRTTSTHGETRTLEVLNTEGKRVRYVNVHGIEGKLLAMELHQPTGFGLGGINKGDTIIIQEDAKFNEEDVIMYESEHGFLIGQLVGKSIVHKSYDIRHVAHLADVSVVGKVVQCIKNF
jgi:hypothetical protein